LQRRIIGGGPIGSALASYLSRAGREVVKCQRGKRPPILVGESLVPAIIPFLRKLGVEEEVKSYSTYKPGATFTFTPETRRSFCFAEVRGCHTTYAYNVRAEFDATSCARVASGASSSKRAPSSGAGARRVSLRRDFAPPPAPA
jgi:2-polyprenyl-6-methoxyphenol hydroxylase-like FAD-dependent oxidoreductase